MVRRIARAGPGRAGPGAGRSGGRGDEALRNAATSRRAARLETRSRVSTPAPRAGAARPRHDLPAQTPICTSPRGARPPRPSSTTSEQAAEDGHRGRSATRGCTSAEAQLARGQRARGGTELTSRPAPIPPSRAATDVAASAWGALVAQREGERGAPVENGRRSGPEIALAAPRPEGRARVADAASLKPSRTIRPARAMPRRACGATSSSLPRAGAPDQALPRRARRRLGSAPTSSGQGREGNRQGHRILRSRLLGTWRSSTRAREGQVEQAAADARMKPTRNTISPKP